MPQVWGPKQGGPEWAAGSTFLGLLHVGARPAAPTPTPSPKPIDFSLIPLFRRPGPCRGRALAEQAVLWARPFRGEVQETAFSALSCRLLRRLQDPPRSQLCNNNPRPLSLLLFPARARPPSQCFDSSIVLVHACLLAETAL